MRVRVSPRAPLHKYWYMKQKNEESSKSLEVNVDADGYFAKYVKYHANPLHVIWRGFLFGTFQGLGFVVGSALLLTLLGFLIKDIISEIPIFHDLGNALNFWLENANGIKK